MKKIRFTARFRATRSGDLPGAAPIEAPEPGGPDDRYRQQGELNVNEIAQQHRRIQLGRRDVDAAIGGRERTTRIDRIRDQRRRDPDQEGDAERRALQKGLPAARQQERAGKIQAIARRQEQIGQAEIDGEPDQQARSARSAAADAAAAAAKNFAVRKPASRADHHGRRHRIARLGRVDHQIDRGKPEHRGQRQRSRIDGRETARAAQRRGSSGSPAHRAGSPEIPRGNSASANPVPGGYCMHIFVRAGIKVWQGTRLDDRSIPQSRSPSACSSR